MTDRCPASPEATRGLEQPKSDTDGFQNLFVNDSLGVIPKAQREDCLRAIGAQNVGDRKIVIEELTNIDITQGSKNIDTRLNAVQQHESFGEDAKLSKLIGATLREKASVDVLTPSTVHAQNVSGEDNITLDQLAPLGGPKFSSEFSNTTSSNTPIHKHRDVETSSATHSTLRSSLEAWLATLGAKLITSDTKFLANKMFGGSGEKVLIKQNNLFEVHFYENDLKAAKISSAIAAPLAFYALEIDAKELSKNYNTPRVLFAATAVACDLVAITGSAMMFNRKTAWIGNSLQKFGFLSREMVGIPTIALSVVMSGVPDEPNDRLDTQLHSYQ